MRLESRKWSKKDTNTLQVLYGKMPVKQISAVIGRSETAIFNKAHKMNLHGMRDSRDSEILHESVINALIDEGTEGRTGLDGGPWFEQYTGVDNEKHTH